MKRAWFTPAAVLAGLVLLAPFSAPAREVLTPEERAERELEAKRQAAPVLAVEPAGFRMEIKEDETRTVRLRVWNAGGRKLMWSVVSAPRWVTFDVRGGELGFQEKRSLILTVDPAGTPGDSLRGSITIEATDADGSPAAVPVVVSILRPPREEPQVGPEPVVREKPAPPKPPPPREARRPKPPPSTGRDARDAGPVLPPSRGFTWEFSGGYRRQKYQDDFLDYDVDGFEAETVYHFRPVRPGKYPVKMAAFADRVPWIDVHFQGTSSVDVEPRDETRDDLGIDARYAAEGRPLEVGLRYYRRGRHQITQDDLYENGVDLVEARAGYFVSRTMSVSVLLGAHSSWTWYDDFTQPGTEVDIESTGTRWGFVVEGLIPFAEGSGLGVYGRYRSVRPSGSSSATQKLNLSVDYYVNSRTGFGIALMSNSPPSGTRTDTIGFSLSSNFSERTGLDATYEIQESEYSKTTTVSILLVLRM